MRRSSKTKTRSEVPAKTQMTLVIQGYYGALYVNGERKHQGGLQMLRKNMGTLLSQVKSPFTYEEVEVDGTRYDSIVGFPFRLEDVPRPNDVESMRLALSRQEKRDDDLREVYDQVGVGRASHEDLFDAVGTYFATSTRR